MSNNKIFLNTGLKRYEVNDDGAVFSFNAKDFNLVAKLEKMAKKIEAIMDEIGKESEKVTASLKAKGIKEGSAEAGLDEKNLEFCRKLEEADRQVKDELRNCFGKQNDFDAIFDYVNALSITDNGACVVTNFLEAITPIIKKDVNAAINQLKKQKVAELNQHSKSKKKKR